VWWFGDASELWQELLVIGALLETILLLVTIPWVLMSRKETTSTVAWCLLVFFVPLVGSLIFFVFGYQHVNKPLARKRRHKQSFQLANPPTSADAADLRDESWKGLSHLAQHFGCPPATTGNRVDFYTEGQPAYEAKLAAIEAAQHHIHLEYFIVQPDASGQRFRDALVRKARAGVEVRLIYDAIGSRKLTPEFLQQLRDAGAQVYAFMPLNLLRRRLQVNLRDHRKILIVDGHVAFTGGLNIGDEYLGLSPRHGFWRDTHVRIEGPAVLDLQRVFCENWDFAADQALAGPAYFPTPISAGPHPVQVVESGPDRELKAIREVYFAAIWRARRSVWIATPYFVPDAGLRDALILAGYLGLDVRLLGQFHPDKWIPYFAGRWYWADMLDAGVKVYQYTRGMMHAKVVIVDGSWASVGTANLDNRSLHLNFEVNCLFDTPALAAELAEAFQRDLAVSVQLDRAVFAQRPLAGRLIENGCRLLSPIL
jgi:cardiolipin synthase